MFKCSISTLLLLLFCVSTWTEAKDVDHVLKRLAKEITKKELCDFCALLMPMARNLVHRNKTAHLGDIAAYLCNKKLKISDETVCQMAVEEYEPTVISVVRYTSLTSNELCSLALGCSNIDNPILRWNITLPDVPKPPVEPYIPPKPDAKTLRILHLADIHIDFEYEPGALADCDQPLCCRNESTANSTVGRVGGAGYWGDYRRCDVPLWTVKNMFEHIASSGGVEHFDVVYWTGDLPPHNIWNQTRAQQLSALRVLTRLFQEYFPGKLVLPSLGNHEAQPCNLYPTPYVKDDSIEWLYSTLAEEWTKTGLPNDLYNNITRGAFYSIKLLPKLRLISLNTNYCPKENFWLIINSTDPLGQLQWLADTLHESENNGEKVHIIGHIDPSKCLSSWSRNYYSIVNRYESTIRGQFFGHTHKDEIKIFYDLVNTTRPVSVAYLAPSVTTESYLNPAYRIYELDAFGDDATMQLVDYETVYMNLTEANEMGTPKWTREYAAKRAYGLADLSPSSWSNLVEHMLAHLWGSAADNAVRFYSKSSPAFPKCDDVKCRKELICAFKNARSDQIVC